MRHDWLNRKPNWRLIKLTAFNIVFVNTFNICADVKIFLKPLKGARSCANKFLNILNLGKNTIILHVMLLHHPIMKVHIQFIIPIVNKTYFYFIIFHSDCFCLFQVKLRQHYHFVNLLLWTITIDKQNITKTISHSGSLREILT